MPVSWAELVPLCLVTGAILEVGPASQLMTSWANSRREERKGSDLPAQRTARALGQKITAATCYVIQAATQTILPSGLPKVMIFCQCLDQTRIYGEGSKQERLLRLKPSTLAWHGNLASMVVHSIAVHTSPHVGAWRGGDDCHWSLRP